MARGLPDQLAHRRCSRVADCAVLVLGSCRIFLVLVDAAETMSKLQTGVGVGQSSFLAAIAVVWIGGMVFFGIGSLLANGDMDVMQRAADD